jgi:hypothetical protein
MSGWRSHPRPTPGGRLSRRQLWEATRGSSLAGDESSSDQCLLCAVAPSIRTRAGRGAQGDERSRASDCGAPPPLRACWTEERKNPSSQRVFLGMRAARSRGGGTSGASRALEGAGDESSSDRWPLGVVNTCSVIHFQRESDPRDPTPFFLDAAAGCSARRGGPSGVGALRAPEIATLIQLGDFGKLPGAPPAPWVEKMLGRVQA